MRLRPCGSLGGAPFLENREDLSLPSQVDLKDPRNIKLPILVEITEGKLSEEGEDKRNEFEFIEGQEVEEMHKDGGG